MNKWPKLGKTNERPGRRSDKDELRDATGIEVLQSLVGRG